MNQEPFVDYYEVLQVSPNVDVGTIERVFRYLAKRFHPDNPETGNSDQFDLVMKAYRVLSDEERRVAYDITHARERSAQNTLVEESADFDDLDRDRVLRERLLSTLYVKRRRDLQDPGLGTLDLEKMLGRPREVLDFHIWFLKEKGWIERTDSGHLAITANGCEQVETNLRGHKHKLLEDHGAELRAKGGE